MASIRDDAYWESVEDHGLACAKYGDCIFNEVQEGAQDLENAWTKRAGFFSEILQASAKTGIFGLGKQIDLKWLHHVIFGPKKNWPSGLTLDDRLILELARANSGYLSGPSLGVTVDPLSGYDASFQKAGEEATLSALRKFSKLYRKDVLLPMWGDYEHIAVETAKRIAPLCLITYGESCTPTEAIGMFKGDLQRGWKVRSLGFSAASYHVFPAFMDCLE